MSIEPFFTDSAVDPDSQILLEVSDCLSLPFGNSRIDARV